jgi:hypothetical protein
MGGCSNRNLIHIKDLSFMTKINLLFTFDYELPLGGCSSYSKGLFEPADALLELASVKKIKIVLFADICSSIFFKERDFYGYYKPFRDQLEKAISSNHEVQLHLHPHWLNSTFENGRYYPSSSKILSNFRNEEYPLNIEGIIEAGAKSLNEICSSGKPYKCIAYRGGGYNLRPDTDIIFKSLYNNGIKFDSSIIKGYYFKSDIQEADFRRMPEKANWIIPLEGPLNAFANTGIMEIPIASMPVNLYFRLLRIYNKTKNRNLYKQLKYDNTGIGHTGRKSDLAVRINNFIYSPLVLSFDHLHQDMYFLDAIIKHQFKIYRKEEEIALCVNSHPKTMGSFHLKQMEKFIDMIQSKYKDSINICGYGDLHI